MADWFAIPDTAVDPDAPVTSELMYALRDNPIAIAEGAVGAPRFSRVALNSSTGSLTGALAASGAVTLTIGAYAFMPNIIVNPGVAVWRSVGAGSADDVRLEISNTTASASTYTVTWRRLLA